MPIIRVRAQNQLVVANHPLAASASNPTSLPTTSASASAAFGVQSSVVTSIDVLSPGTVNSVVGVFSGIQGTETLITSFFLQSVAGGAGISPTVGALLSAPIVIDVPGQPNWFLRAIGAGPTADFLVTYHLARQPVGIS